MLTRRVNRSSNVVGTRPKMGRGLISLIKLSQSFSRNATLVGILLSNSIFIGRNRHNFSYVRLLTVIFHPYLPMPEGSLAFHEGAIALLVL